MPSTQPKPRSKKSDLPHHAFVDEHKLLLQAKVHGTRQRVRDAKSLRPTGEVACARIHEYARDIGEIEMGGVRWVKYAAEKIGIGYDCLLRIVNEQQYTVSSKSVDAIIKTTGIPAKYFYDAEE